MWATKDDEGERPYVIWNTVRPPYIDNYGQWTVDEIDDVVAAEYTEAEWQAMPNAPTFDVSGYPQRVRLVVEAVTKEQ